MKKFYLRLLTSDEFSSNSYVRRFDSISSLLTFLIREYSIENIDSIGFDDFDVKTQFDDDDDDDNDNNNGFLPIPRIMPFFKRGE